MKESHVYRINAQYVDIFNRLIFPATITVENGYIIEIKKRSGTADQGDGYLLPGFIDSHVHIESSMLIPSEFARLAVVHGTIGTVSDPHEIANVCGLPGIEFMIRNGKTVPFKFCWGAPSCVPATTFETAGALIDVESVKQLLQRDDIGYLSEMMNFPGVLRKDPHVLNKIHAAFTIGKPVDGHAPGLRGNDAAMYIQAGITTDHECFTAEEALDKLRCGMKIIIREGSAARNFDALVSLLDENADHMMFGSDDKHPDSLVRGHINELCARAVKKKVNVFKVLKVACINPVEHYRMNVGLLRLGDPADFILVKDLHQFQVVKTYINGLVVAENGKSTWKVDLYPQKEFINRFNATIISAKQLEVGLQEIQLQNGLLPAIGVVDGQLLTNSLEELPLIEKGCYISDTKNDLLKIVVVNRYKNAPVSKAFIKNTGIRSGAIASSVAHDSHNVIAIGTDDELLCKAINLIIENKGGISCTTLHEAEVLPLPVAGLMSTDDGYTVADAYTRLDRMAKSTGCSLQSPFMTLSFMALLVIPELKLSDLGLFDGNLFEFKYLSTR